MGTCASKPPQKALAYSRPVTLAELADIPMGGKWVGGSGTGCGPQGSLSITEQRLRERGFNYPPNGEFQFTSGPGCPMCSNIPDYGCECSDATGDGRSVPGWRPALTRLSFGADKTQCCLGTTNIIGDKTCDPIYRGKAKAACKDVLRAYCDNATNFFTPTCKEWVGNLNEQLKNQLAQKYCPGSTNQWCACWNLTMPPDWKGTTKESLVRCLSPKCNNNDLALQPFGLNCPTSFVECQQNDIKLALQQSGIDTATIENKCGAIQFGAPGAAPGVAPTPGAAPSTAKKGLSNTSIYGIVGGSAALILIIIIIIVALVGAKKKKAAL